MQSLFASHARSTALKDSLVSALTSCVRLRFHAVCGHARHLQPLTRRGGARGAALWLLAAARVAAVRPGRKQRVSPEARLRAVGRVRSLAVTRLAAVRAPAAQHLAAAVEARVGARDAARFLARVACGGACTGVAVVHAVVTAAAARVAAGRVAVRRVVAAVAEVVAHGDAGARGAKFSSALLVAAQAPAPRARRTAHLKGR
jgi:hypothetical protein